MPNKSKSGEAATPRPELPRQGTEILESLRSLIQQNEQALRGLPQASPKQTVAHGRHVLIVVDDQESVREAIRGLAQKFPSIEIHCLNPVELRLKELVETIVQIVYLGLPDLDTEKKQSEAIGRARSTTLLIDHHFDGLRISGLDLVRKLDEDARPMIQALPRAMVTANDFSEKLVDEYLGRGADDVLFQKGDAPPASLPARGKHSPPAEPSDFQTSITFAPLLATWPQHAHRIWLRSQQRFWRQLLERFETLVNDDYRTTAGLSPEDMDDQHVALWTNVRKHVLDSGFADHAHLRRLKHVGSRWRLQSLPPFQSELAVVEDLSWEEVPLLKELVDRADADHAYVWRTVDGIKPDDLGKLGDHRRPLAHLVGSHGLGVCLSVSQRPWGTLTLTRGPLSRPFTTADEAQLRRLARRWALHAEQLEQRALLRHRQIGLANLSSKLAQCPSEDAAVREAISFLFEELFPLVPARPGRKLVVRSARVSCRLLDTGSGLVYRRPAWVRSSVAERSPILLRLDDASGLYPRVIRSGLPEFSPDVSLETAYRLSTDQPMGATFAVPLSGGSGSRRVAIGALMCDHADAGFFGLKSERSIDFPFVTAVANLLAQTLVGLRDQALHAGLLALAASMGRENRDSVLDKMAHLVYEAVGFAVMGWCPRPRNWREENGNDPWPVSRVWCGIEPSAASQELQRDLPTHLAFHEGVGGRILAYSEREEAPWDVRDSSEVWLKTGVGQAVTQEQSRVRYSESEGEGFRLDTANWGLVTRSQATVPVIASHLLEGPELLGVLFLGFPQAPGITEAQEGWLDELGALLGQYLEAIRSGEAYLEAPFRRQLTEVTQDVKHSLKRNIQHLHGMLTESLRELEDSSVATRRIKEAQRALERFERSLVRADWDFRPVRKDKLNVATVWNSVVDSVAEQYKPTLKIENLTNAVKLRDADERVLRMVFENLIANTFEAAAPDYDTRIMSANVSLIAEAGLNSPEGEELISLRYRDSGPGFESDESKRRAFEFGFSTKSKGTGWGLYWCRERLREMGGDIELVDAPGPGACFVLANLKLVGKGHD